MCNFIRFACVEVTARGGCQVDTMYLGKTWQMRDVREQRAKGHSTHLKSYSNGVALPIIKAVSSNKSDSIRAFHISKSPSGTSGGGVTFHTC